MRTFPKSCPIRRSKYDRDADGSGAPPFSDGATSASDWFLRLIISSS
jgi:hypothetical protein